MLLSQSTRSRFTSDSFESVSRPPPTSRRASVTLRQVSVGGRRFSIATLTGQESAFVRMEQAMLRFSSNGGRRVKSSNGGRKSHKFLETFRRVVKSVILLLKCFRMRRKFAVQSRNMTLTHSEQTDGFEMFRTSSISRELQNILSTPPEHRTKEYLRKVQFYLRATGASRLLASASTPEDLDNLSRYVAYERYENDRVVAQQGRSPDRFYFVITGKLLIVKEYHINTGIISKTVGVLTKGMTTNVEEMEQRTLRRASLICRGPVETLVLDTDDYFLIHGERGGAPREFLSRHALFRSFPFHSVKCHKHLIRLQYFPKGAIIFGGAKDFEWIYAIKSGECSLVRMQMVADLKRRNYPLFNKRTAEELGCQRVRRAQSAAEKLADFRMWQGRPRQKSSMGMERSRTAPNIQTSKMSSANYLTSSPKTTKEEVQEADRANHLPHASQKIELPRISVNSGNGAATGNSLMRSTSSNHAVRRLISDELTVTTEANVSTAMPVLSKSRFASSLPPKTPQFQGSKRKLTGSKSAPPSSRHAYLELGKLRPGDVLGLEESTVQIEDLPHVRLISDTGAEVVLVNRKFFMRNAPTTLLSRISCQTAGYPGIEKARSDYETLEAWAIYKSSLMRVLTSRGTIPEKLRTPEYGGQSSQFRNSSYRGAPHTARLIPPGTADRSKTSSKDTARSARNPKLYTNLPSRSITGPRPALLSAENVKFVKGMKLNLVPN